MLLTPDRSRCKVLQCSTGFTRSSATGWHRVSCLSPSQLALLASLLQLAVALGVDLCLSPCEHIVWRHVADGAVQPDIAVTAHIQLDQAFCIFQ